MSSSYTFPVVLGPNGLQPQSPTSLRAQIAANVAAMSPGYTSSLPGSMIDDILSTDVGAVALIDQAKVELVNSITPNGANIFLLQQLAQIYLGQSQPGMATNTSALVVFSSMSAIGYVIPNGLLVTDGTNVFQVQGGGVVAATGLSSPLTVISINPGTFAVPALTINAIQSSVPASLKLTVSNPTAGTPAGAAETWFAFRARVLQAGLAACVGTARFAKTLLGEVLGTQSNLVSVQQTPTGLRFVVGGAADTFEIANAILQSVADVSSLQGSAVSTARNVSVSLVDYPDTYIVLYVNAPQQSVKINITWNTTLTNFTGGGAFPSLVQGPLAAYINSLAIGQPINVLEMNEIFQQSTQNVLDSSLVTRLLYQVFINSNITAPGAGTFAIAGDPESYFSMATTDIQVLQG